MSLLDTEKKLAELKGKQADIMKQKKANRDKAALEAVRKEMNELKGQVKAEYRKK